jgi:hypothetical protein
MELFKRIILDESEKAAHREILYAIRSINETYAEWLKRIKNRRKNAVALVTTSINKITTISPETIGYINSDMRQKLSIIIMRCLALPAWKAVSGKKSTYRKLYPYFKELENIIPNTGTKGNLREIVLTKFSAAITIQSKYPEVFVAYEPLLPKDYLKYLFGEEKFPTKTYRMQSLLLPEDFDELIDTLTINHKKAVDLYLRKQPSSYK